MLFGLGVTEGGVTEGVTEGEIVSAAGVTTGSNKGVVEVTEGVLLVLGRRTCGSEPSSVMVMVW